MVTKSQSGEAGDTINIFFFFCEWNPDRLALVGRVVTRWAWLRWVHRGERFPDAVRGFADRRCWMIYRQMRVIIVSGKLIDTDVCFDFSKRTCSHSVRHRTATGYLGTQGIKRTGRHHSVDVPQLHLKPKTYYLCVIHWDWERGFWIILLFLFENKERIWVRLLQMKPPIFLSYYLLNCKPCIIRLLNCTLVALSRPTCDRQCCFVALDSFFHAP